MNARDLTEYLKDPSRLAPGDHVKLKEILRDTPWFTGARILYALSLYRDGQPGHASEMRKAALCVADRKKLRELVELFGKPAVERARPSEIQVVTETAPAPVPEPVEEASPQPVPADEAPRLVFSKEELIEKFIREEPRIAPPKAAFFNPTESALRSNIDDDEIVSETLAQLFAEQGNPARAIRIYEKLCLLIPEKSSYFAAQISKLSSK